MKREGNGGAPYSWVGMTVRRAPDGEPVDVGALRFAGASLTLKKKVASFVEIYGPPIRPDQIPTATITFGTLRLNGREVRPVEASVVYPTKTPDYAAARDGRIEVRVGAPVTRQARSQRYQPGATMTSRMNFPKMSKPLSRSQVLPAKLSGLR